jgi:hypothetical protein
MGFPVQYQHSAHHMPRATNAGPHTRATRNQDRGGRGGDTDRQRDRHHDAVRSRQRSGRRKNACHHLVVLFDEYERPDRCSQKDRRRIDHREDKRAGEQRQRPDGKPRRITRRVAPRDTPHASQCKQEREVVDGDDAAPTRDAERPHHADDTRQHRKEGPAALDRAERRVPVPRAGDQQVPSPVPPAEGAGSRRGSAGGSSRNDQRGRDQPRHHPRKHDLTPRKQSGGDVAKATPALA